MKTIDDLNKEYEDLFWIDKNNILWIDGISCTAKELREIVEVMENQTKVKNV